MPLESIHLINEESSWAIWKISEEIGHFFLNLNLQDEEMHSLDLISNHYKKLEWLATRITTKSLIEHLGIDYVGMTKDEHGKPNLNNNKGYISVTHSFPYVAIIYHHRFHVGIDLEKPREKILQISKKFLNPSEIAFCGSNTRKITLIWSAKEALYKLHGRKFVIFKEDLEIKEFELQKEGIIEGIILLNGHETLYDLKYELHEEYLVTYTVR